MSVDQHSFSALFNTIVNLVSTSVLIGLFVYVAKLAREWGEINTIVKLGFEHTTHELERINGKLIRQDTKLNGQDDKLDDLAREVSEIRGRIEQ